ncbi:hypothetical protein M422DRAFT_263126 [Sphaerobolus stellatus SS14]|uniref:Uncharacterized protein n=1 Tax=Sphaerobolus stellatus (strain SS14) TaxID=990650 RepID=A0A0C9TWJ1_SPHS4|nr:hypothetical protein M422DRAFT_263126 [Sphaerobolus stellatus SS14]
MEKYWGVNNICGPVHLPNNDASAAISGGAEPPKPVQGGAVRATSLTGAIFNHKDDKKGEQDSLRCAFEAVFSFPLNFPDTSNTWYQSHCEAAAELITNLPSYQDYILLMKDRKESRTLNHMELNLQIALDDIPTFSELCIFTVFLQCINMGPFHSKVEQHMERLIADPMLVLASDAKFETATMDGKPWDRAKVIFFTGALETWKRFTAEFAPGGLIASASSTLHAQAWMPTTNDDAIKLKKKKKNAEVIAQIVPILSLDELLSISLKNSQLDEQLMWHRQFNYEIAKKTTYSS